MSVTIQIPAAAPTLPATPYRPASEILADLAERCRAGIRRALAPSFAEVNGRDFDLFRATRWYGCGPDAVTWSDLGYRL